MKVSLYFLMTQLNHIDREFVIDLDDSIDLGGESYHSICSYNTTNLGIKNNKFITALDFDYLFKHDMLIDLDERKLRKIIKTVLLGDGKDKCLI